MKSARVRLQGEPMARTTEICGRRNTPVRDQGNKFYSTFAARLRALK